MSRVTYARISLVCVACRCHIDPGLDRACDRDHLCGILCLRTHRLAVVCEAGRYRIRRRSEILLAGVGRRRDMGDVLDDFGDSRSLDLSPSPAFLTVANHRRDLWRAFVWAVSRHRHRMDHVRVCCAGEVGRRRKDHVQACA